MRRISKTAALGAATLIALPALAAQHGPAVLVGARFAPVEEVTAAPAPRSRTVDLALCLDTSGSMDGLIDAAKQRLWAIVSDLALAEPAPELRVALLTYGNDGYDAEDGWVRVDVGLTTDLDLVSQRLFALRTNGGTELVGRVLSVATGSLDWSADPNALKIAVVAGNESADQDQVVPFRDATRTAIGSGILVDSIYCGGEADAEAPSWREVAKLADGVFATIDQQGGTLAVDTPFDERLAALTASVNETYLPFGDGGQSAWTNQKVQDSNVAELNGDALANRALCKNTALYRCAWDLVDMCDQEDFDLAAVAVDDLPEEMRAMTPEERVAHVAAKKQERLGIQERVAEVGARRAQWLDAELARRGLDEERSFDRALRAKMRARIVQQGFAYPEPEPAAAPASAEPEESPEAEAPAEDGAESTGTPAWRGVPFRLPTEPQAEADDC